MPVDTKTPKKAADRSTQPLPVPAIGVDIGTAYIASARMHDDNQTVELQNIRDCFVSMPADEAPNLELAGVDFHTSEDGESLIVVGAQAIELAAIQALELRRPLAQGFVSAKEDLGKEVIGIILRHLLGEPLVADELAVYSVPGPTLGDDTSRAQYHARFFADRIRELGFKPLPINEAMAVVYSAWKWLEAQNSKLTGLGISFGAGMVNVALVHKGMLVRSFSIPYGGDFIDEGAAKATNSTVAQVTLLKEEGINLAKGTIAGEPKAYHDTLSHRQAEALTTMYHELLSKLRKALEEFFGRPENRVGDVKTVLPVVVSGGTSRPAGFLDLFDDLVLSGLELRFPLAQHATHVDDPMGAVTLGALTLARLRTAKLEGTR